MSAVSPNSDVLRFGLFSGGSITIDRTLCRDCVSKACVRRCVSSTLDPVLAIRDGAPELARAEMKPENGWCVECLACELDCQRDGRGAVRIELPDDLKEADVHSH
jgi:hypothetical protein